MSPKITPILEDPRTYVSNHGIVEIQYGIENSRTIDWQADFYDYVRDYMRKGERFSKEFGTKNKETGKQYWFACIVCPCNLKSDDVLVKHVMGQRHQKRAIEKIDSQKKMNRRRKSFETNDVPSEVFGNSRSSRSDLQYRLKYGPSYPVLGLEYITEYVNPGNPNKDPMYTCSLEVCKSAWGTASEIYNHLTTNKNKHNRRYLEKFYDIPNLTLDQIFNKSRQVFDEKKAKNNGKFDYHIKQITNVKEYSELKNRPLDWSEKNERRKRERPESDLKHYKIPTREEKAQTTFEAIDTLQTQMQLHLEKLQNSMTSEKTTYQLKMLIDRCIYNIDVMFAIISKNNSLISQIRLDQVKERHTDLTAQYRNFEQISEMNRQNNAIACQFIKNTIFEENHSSEEKQAKKSKLDMKTSKIDIKGMSKFTPLGDTSAYGNEIGTALEISDRMLESKCQNKEIVNQYTKDTIFEEKKPKLDVKNSKIDIKEMSKFTPLGDTSAYGNEIGAALEISDRMLESGRQNNEILTQFTKDTIFEQKKPKLDVKNLKIDIKEMSKFTQLGDTSAYGNEISTALKISDRMLESKCQNNEILNQFVKGIIFEDKKPKLEVKEESKLNIKSLKPITKLEDSKVYENEISLALEVSNQITPDSIYKERESCKEVIKTLELMEKKSKLDAKKPKIEISNHNLDSQDMKDLFQNKVYQYVKEYLDSKGYGQPDKVEKIAEKIVNSEIQSWTKNNERDPNNFQWSNFLFGEKHKRNVKMYLDQKFGNRK